MVLSLERIATTVHSLENQTMGFLYSCIGKKTTVTLLKSDVNISATDFLSRVADSKIQQVTVTCTRGYLFLFQF